MIFRLSGLIVAAAVTAGAEQLRMLLEPRPTTSSTTTTTTTTTTTERPPNAKYVASCTGCTDCWGCVVPVDNSSLVESCMSAATQYSSCTYISQYTRVSSFDQCTAENYYVLGFSMSDADDDTFFENMMQARLIVPVADTNTASQNTYSLISTSASGGGTSCRLDPSDTTRPDADWVDAMVLGKNDTHLFLDATTYLTKSYIGYGNYTILVKSSGSTPVLIGGYKGQLQVDQSNGAGKTAIVTGLSVVIVALLMYVA